MKVIFLFLILLAADCAAADSISELIDKGAISEAIKRAESKEVSANEKSDGLIQGIMYGASDLVESLIKAGASVNDDTYMSVCTARHFHLLKSLFASREPTLVAREKLFFCAIDQDAQDAYPLLAQANKLPAEVIGKGFLSLLAQGRPADALAKLKPSLKVTDEQGRTALHWAVMREDRSLAQSLLKNGADKKVKDSSGKTPGDYAKEIKLEVPGL